MSQENVETLRRMYEALNGGDDQPLRDLLRPDFVYRSRQELPGGGAYGAHDLLRRLDELSEIFPEGRFQPEEFICSDSAIIVRVRVIARGRVSGVPIDEHLFHVWTMESGKASALCIYAARAEALEAVGLSEQDVHAGP